MSVNQYLQDWQEDQKLDEENDIKEDLGIMRVNNWAKCIQYRVTWKEVVEKAKTFQQCCYCAMKQNTVQLYWLHTTSCHKSAI
jgi:hypothetical protein